MVGGADAARAAKLFKKSAKEGDRWSALTIAQLNDGKYLGAESSFEEAAKYFRIAADKGDKVAMRELGRYYRPANESTLGAAVGGSDAKKAFTWYRKAYDAGNSWAAFEIATMLEDGELAAPDCSDSALDWYLRAVESDSHRNHPNNYIWAVAVMDSPPEKHLKKAAGFKERLLEDSRHYDFGTLAAFEARTGHFEKAVKYQQRAIEMLLS